MDGRRLAFALHLCLAGVIACGDQSPAAPASLTLPPAPYEPAANAVFVMQDNMDRYTDATSLGAFPYQYAAPQFSPNPAPSQTSTPVDTAHVHVIAPGRGGTGKALRLSYDGIPQETHNLATVNLPLQPINRTVFIQYYARITPATNWPQSQALAVKWLEAWHANNVNSRIQWNTRYPSSDHHAQRAPTVWQVIDLGESPTNGDQPFGPFFHEVADGQWHRYTHAFRAHHAPGAADGFSKMWIDTTQIIDIEQSTVGVTPLRGLFSWCSQADVNNLTSAEGVAYFVFGGPQTTETGPWTYDIDDVRWWLQ